MPRARVARANGKVNHAFYYRLRGIPENSWRSLEKPKPSVDSLSALLSLWNRRGERRDGLDTYLSRCRSNLPWVFLVSLVPCSFLFRRQRYLLDCTWWKTKERGESLLVRFERLQESRFVWYRSCAETGRVVKVYRFCLIVVICNVWILTIPLHVEFLWYVAVFTFEHGVSFLFIFRIRILISYQRKM